MSSEEAAVVGLVKAVSAPGTSLEESQRAYSKWAQTYEQDLLREGYRAHKITAQYACLAIPHDQRASARVLDIGAGTGLVARELRREGFHRIDALEPSERMLELARKDNLYDNYFVEYITRDPCSLSENSYDVITGSGIYAAESHVPHDAIYDMIRLTKPGGHIVLVSRTNLLETPKNTALEPLMDTLEAEGRWKKIARDIVGKMYLDYDAIVWHYQKL